MRYLTLIIICLLLGSVISKSCRHHSGAILPVRDDAICEFIQRLHIDTAVSIANLWLMQEIIDGLNKIQANIGHY